MNAFNINNLAALNLKHNSYFSRQHRLLYVATPKVACTSLKWWFAELLGIRAAIETSRGSSESDPELVIHDTFNRVAPDFTGINSTGLIEALTSPGYFRFCVVRNPYTRVFSAWQSKWLLQEPLQAHYYRESINGGAERSKDTIRKSFEDFLRFIWKSRSSSELDLHVAPQFALLEPEKINYQFIAKIESPLTLIQALKTHVGLDSADPLIGPRQNESLLPYSSDWVSDEASETIRKLYAHDFEFFGYASIAPSGAVALSDDALEMAFRSIKLISGRNARIGNFIERIKSSPVLNTDDAPIESLLRIHEKSLQKWRLADFSGYRPERDSCQIDEGRRLVRFTFSSVSYPLEGVRLCIVGRPLVLLIHALWFETPEGAYFWSWSGDREAIINCKDVVIREHNDGLIAISTATDSQFELSVPIEILSQVQPSSSFIVEMTIMPFVIGCAELIRADEQRMVDLMERNRVNDKELKRFSMVRDEIIRAEAQLHLLKDVMLSSKASDVI